MIDSFLPIPDAETLPFYLMVLKLAWVRKREGENGGVVGVNRETEGNIVRVRES
jgi:hypothetical protein